MHCAGTGPAPQRTLPCPAVLYSNSSNTCEAEAIGAGSLAARLKMMVMRPIGSCLGSQKRLPEAVKAFRACNAQAQVLLPNVSCHAPHFLVLL
jgi:hypothetical protein